MRKIYSILLCVLCLSAIGCSDDKDTADVALKAIRSDVKFSANGGTGTIELSGGKQVSATSDVAWCKVASVSDQEVSLVVEANLSISSRTTMVVIQSGEDILQVPVTQLGDTFICDVEGTKDFLMQGGEAVFTLHTRREYSIQSTAEWLTYELKGDQLHVVVSPMLDGTDYREGTLTVQSGKNEWSATCVQRGLSGTYTMMHTRNDGKRYTGSCTFTATDEKGVYDLIAKDVPLNNGVPFKAVLTDGRLVINFDNQYLGFISPNYIYLCAYDKAANVLTWGGNITYVADLQFTKAGLPFFEFKDDGTWKDHKVDGFMYGIFDKKWENGGQFAGKSDGYAVDIVMVHQ